MTPLPDGTPTSAEVLAEVHRNQGPIFSPNYDQAAALRKAARRAVANAKAPEVSEGQPAAPSATAGDPLGQVVEIMRADGIKPEPVEWIWSGYIARGKLHIIAGAPGTGKTTIALAEAATVSSGGRWPDGTRATAADVLIWSGEDSPADTLVPRLITMGADLSRVHIVRGVTEADGERRWFDPAKDFPALKLAAARLSGLRLMIVDPIVSAVAGDSHKNSETRRGLQPLVEFAEQIGCALMGVTHFSKASSGREPIERVIGSIAFAAVPRIIMATAKLPEDEGGCRVFVRAKSNIGPDGGGFRYELRQEELDGKYRGIVASRVEWVSPIEGTAREILARAEPVIERAGGRDRGELDDAVEWLRTFLADGTRGSKEIEAEGRSAGFSLATLRRARAELTIETYREGGIGPLGHWACRLAPPKVLTDSNLTCSPEHLSQNPHAALVPAKALSEHLKVGNGEHLSGAEVF